MPVAFHQPHLVIAHGLALLRRRGPTSVGAQFPAPGRRIHRRLEHLVQLRLQPRILHLRHHLDPAVEITMHHVGTADPELVDGAEVNNSRVFEESPQNRAHHDVLGEAGDARPQRADAPHHDFDPHTGL